MFNQDLIIKKINVLPEHFQEEIMHYIDYLQMKNVEEKTRAELCRMNDFSLQRALSDMEDEDTSAFQNVTFIEKY